MPRRLNTCSRTSAASASSPGSTRSRLLTSVDVDAQRLVGAGELGAGDAGADHHQVLGPLVERVHLLPGQDPLAVGLRGRQRARRGAGRDQHGVGLERLLAVRRGVATTRCGPVEPAGATHDPDAVAGQPALDVRRTARAPGPAPAVDPGEVDGDRRAARTRPKHDAQLGGDLEAGHHLGGGDQRLARHAVGEHRRAADPVAVDDRHVGPQLGGDQRRLVAAGSAADDRHMSHGGHCSRLRQARCSLRCGP